MLARRHLTVMRPETYAARVLSVETDALIGYWPLWDGGATAVNMSGAGKDGTHTAVAMGNAGIGDGRTSGLYDGSTSYTNIYSAGLAAAFNGAEGSLLIWGKVSGVGVWTDGTIRALIGILAQVTDYVIMRFQGNGTILGGIVAGDTSKTAIFTSPTDALWHRFAISWSVLGNALKLYLDGVQQGATVTGLGTWSPASWLTNSSCIGANSTAPGQPFSGTLAHCALWSKALTADQIAYLSKA